MVLLDQEGRFRNHVDGFGGLQGNNTMNLFEDAEGGLWIGLQTGLVRAEVNSPFSIVRGGPSDDLANIYCGDLWFGTMVASDRTGLYRFVAPDPVTATAMHLEHISGSPTSLTTPFQSTVGYSWPRRVNCAAGRRRPATHDLHVQLPIPTGQHAAIAAAPQQDFRRRGKRAYLFAAPRPDYPPVD